MNSYTWIEAHTAEEAAAELHAQRGSALLKAGGVDVLDRLKEQIDQPERLINLRRATGHGLSELAELKSAALPAEVVKLLPGDGTGGTPAARDCFRVGALLTLANLAGSQPLRASLPALAEAAESVATPQIRQLATLGGNVLQRPRCWYFRMKEFPCRKKGGSDCFAIDGENEYHAIFDNRSCAAVHASSCATALIALDAIAAVLGPNGERFLRLSSLLVAPSQPGGSPLREHRLEPSDIITSFYIPRPTATERSLYRKVKQKQSFDWPLAEIAISADVSGGAVRSAKVVLGAVAPVPMRARSAEAALVKLGANRPDAASLRAMAKTVTEGATPLAKNRYKIALAEGLFQSAAFELLAR
jgi:xanthine dehydrogenase YagS FAD-binding subunit